MQSVPGPAPASNSINQGNSDGRVNIPRSLPSTSSLLYPLSPTEPIYSTSNNKTHKHQSWMWVQAQRREGNRVLIRPQNFRIYNQATAALLALEAAPLLLSPSMAAWMASSEPKTVTAFETLVARELGFALLLCSFLSLLFSGELHRLWDDADNVPSASATAASPCTIHIQIPLSFHEATANTNQTHHPPPSQPYSTTSQPVF